MVLCIQKNNSDPEELLRAQMKLKDAKNAHRSLIRKTRHQEDLTRDANSSSILTGNPSKIFKSIRSSKSSSAANVPFITVGEDRYEGDLVPDGLFKSIKNLKSQDQSHLHKSPKYKDWTEDYKYILQLCKHKCDVPEISLEDSTKILLRLKSSVTDFWSVSPMHYRNAGDEGFLHFNFLMNLIIKDMNNSSVAELNIAYAILLHKGHGKSKTSDRSYRTISTCPLLAKGLDTYLHDLFVEKWNSVQADTQYHTKVKEAQLS